MLIYSVAYSLDDEVLSSREIVRPLGRYCQFLHYCLHIVQVYRGQKCRFFTCSKAVWMEVGTTSIGPCVVNGCVYRCTIRVKVADAA